MIDEQNPVFVTPSFKQRIEILLSMAAGHTSAEAVRRCKVDTVTVSGPPS
jgi:hypothetical protein